MTCDVLGAAGPRSGRRSWLVVAFLFAAASFAGWHLTQSVRTAHAQPGASRLMLTSPRQFPTTYKGPSDAVAAMAGNPVALSLAAADLDGDGYGDLAVGYAAQGGGMIAIHRGNIDAFAPQNDAAFWDIARGDFPSPFQPEANLVKIPVHPDFLAAGELIGVKRSALAVAAQGGNTIVILSSDSSGAMRVRQTIHLPGSITAMDVHHLSLTRFHQLVVGIHTASGPQLLIYQGSNSGLSQSASFPMAADIASLTSGDVDGDAVPDLLIAAGGTVSILHSASQTLQAISTPYTVSRAALGRFLDDRSPVLQIALLATDGSLHLLARDGFNPTPYTAQQMTANRLARIAAQRAATPNSAPAAQASGAVVAWQEVESDSGVGVPDSSGKAPLMFRTRVTNNGADDLMLLSTAKLTVVAHPTAQPNEAQIQDRADLGADALAAVPVRVNIDARPGVVFLTNGSTAHSVITPQSSETFTVNSTADGLHSGACAANTAGECTLREAIVEANAFSGTTQISIPNGTYTLTVARAACPAYDAKTGTLDVTQSINLVGGGESSTIIQAGTSSGTGASPNGVDKVFSFNQDITGGCSAYSSFTDATVAVSNLTIQNGYNRGDYTTNFDGAGGAFDADTGSSGNASVTLTNVTLNDNYALPEDGGGFANFNDNGGSGSVNVTNGVISNNQAGGRDGFGWGGGVSVEDAANLTMTGTTVTGNVAKQNGGGIADAGSGFDLNNDFINNNVKLHALTISGNSAGGSGGGVYSAGGGLTIDQESVISNNTSVNNGGGLYVGLYHNSNFSPFGVSFSNITVTGNQTTASSEGYGGGIYLTGGFENLTSFTMSYSRIVNNTSATNSSGSALDWDQAEDSGNPTNLQSIDIAENWWGTNADPFNTGLTAFNADGFNSGTETRGTITYQPYLQLNLSANPTSVAIGGLDDSTVTADFLTNSSGGTENPSDLGVLTGVPIAFDGGVNGAISGAQVAIQNTATATATFSGTHVGTAVVQGTVDNQTSSVDITVDSDTTTTASNQTATFSESSQAVTLSAAVAASSSDTVNTGTVTFTVFNSGNTQVGPAVVSGTVSGGSASASYTLPASSPAGTYSIHANYAGNAGFLSSSDTAHTLTVNPASTTTMASNQTANFSASSQIVSLSATVTSAAGTVNEGTVTFTVLNGASPVGTATTSGTVSGGSASVNYALPANVAIGMYTIQAVYNGDANLTSSSDTAHTLTIAGGTVTAAANATATYNSSNQPVTLNATVTSTMGTVNSGTVTFGVFSGGMQIGVSTGAAGVSNGSASATYTLPGGTSAGTYTIVASYTGTGGFASSSDNTHTLTVNSAPTTTMLANASASFSSSVQNATLSATITSTAGTVSAGTVTFTVLNGSTPVGTATTSGAVSNGNASVNYTIPAATPVGIYTIQAVYNGSTNFAGSSDSTHTLTISSGTTTAAANALATYNSTNQPVTLTASVTSGAGTVNTGTVTFSVFSGGTQIGSATTPANVSNGSASATYSLPGATNAGTYSITAIYAGAGGFGSSSDSTHTLTVNAAATTTTAVNQTTAFSSVAQSVTLSATVTSTAGTVNAGTVTFTVLNGGTPIGAATTSGTVTGGNASVNYTIPGGTASGTYTIQAAYNGSANFSGSTDNSHTLTVSGGPTTTTASNAVTVFSPADQLVTLSAAVTSSAGTVNAGTVTFTILSGGTPVGSSATSGTVTGGGASVNYTLPGGTPVGVYTIQAIYSGGGGYTGSSDSSHTLTVAQATPIVMWGNPADTLFGGALGTGQLNATANVPGTFVYTPAAGAVLPVGNGQTLSTVFTPTDTVDYAIVMDSVQINVLPADGAGLILTEILSRDPSTQNVIVTFTVANSNTVTATGVQVTAATLGTAGTLTALPLAVPDVPSGGSSTVVLTFPSSAGTPGSLEFFSITGSSSLGGFSGSTRVSLP